MNLSAFYQFYTKKVSKDRKIPSKIETLDSFYLEKNIAQIAKANAQVRAGKSVIKSLSELEAMANE